MKYAMLCAIAAAIACPSNAAVFCKKKAGAVLAREACKKGESTLDLSRFGAAGTQGPPGVQGPQGPTGVAAVPFVKDAHGAVVGSLVESDRIVRNLNGDPVLLAITRAGFDPSQSDNLDFESTDCSGAALSDAGTEQRIPLRSAIYGSRAYYPNPAASVADRTINSILQVVNDATTCSILSGTFVAPNGCCYQSYAGTLPMVEMATFDLDTLGLTPPFSMVLP